MTNFSKAARSLFQPPKRLRITSDDIDNGSVDPLWEPAETNARRCRIWDFAVSLHCSIVGTCLTSAELRKILVKLSTPDAENLSEHDVHTIGVALASTRDPGGKLLQKSLDHQHKTTIARFSKAKDSSALLALWESSLTRGDIPGAYWATLTHPTCTEDLIRQAFGAVHMLSHMVGASNRADIQRLRQLEAENGTLRVKIEKQQRQLRNGFVTRDAKITQLTDLVAREMRSPSATTVEIEVHEHTQNQAIDELSHRLEHETLRRQRVERQLEALTASRNAGDRALEQATRECSLLMAEITVIEERLAALNPSGDHNPPSFDLSDCSVLYVGGRSSQIPQLRSLVEKANGGFLHHDGGLENNLLTLPGLVSRADIVVFPVDCISHGAVDIVKRACRQMTKQYVPLRASSLASLLAGLETCSVSKHH